MTISKKICSKCHLQKERVVIMMREGESECVIICMDCGGGLSNSHGC